VTGTRLAGLPPAGVVAAIVVLAAGGATLFGLWHVVVGGVLHGNTRAAEFGAILAAASALILAVAVRFVRRPRRAR
jgi:hypothetical protein